MKVNFTFFLKGSPRFEDTLKLPKEGAEDGMIKLKVALPAELPVRATLQVENKVDADICLEPWDA